MYQRLIALASLSLVGFSCHTLANPTGQSVVSGSAVFAVPGNTLTVTTSSNAIINWQRFSIGTGEIARFIQNSAASAVLNRVVSTSPSTIVGVLSSNGNVFLVNPVGVGNSLGGNVTLQGNFSVGGGIVAATSGAVTPLGGNITLQTNAGQLSKGTNTPAFSGGAIAIQGAAPATTGDIGPDAAPVLALNLQKRDVAF